MGMRDDNMMLILHRQAGMPGFTREINHHHGAANIDVSVVIPPSSWAGLVSAANTSDAAVYQALQEFAGPDFLTDLGSAGLALIRQLVLDLDAH